MFQYFKKLYIKSEQELFSELEGKLLQEQKTFVITANSETFSWGMRDKKVEDLILDSRFVIVPDGISLVRLARSYHIDIKARIPGIDIATKLLEVANKYHKSLYVFGAKEEVLEQFRIFLNKNFPNIILNGMTNGYVDNRDQVMKEIAKTNSDIVLVALGVPQQELLLAQYYDTFEKGILIGVGGAIDVLSGSKKRAPKIFIDHNLEWLYRIATEPKRIKRFIFNNIQLIMKVKKDAKRIDNFK